MDAMAKVGTKIQFEYKSMTYEGVISAIHDPLIEIHVNGTNQIPSERTQFVLNLLTDEDCVFATCEVMYLKDERKIIVEPRGLFRKLERRQHVRIPCRLPILVNGKVLGIVENISLGGLKYNSNVLILKGSNIACQIILNRTNILKAEAMVVNSYNIAKSVAFAHQIKFNTVSSEQALNVFIESELRKKSIR